MRTWLELRQYVKGSWGWLRVLVYADESGIHKVKTLDEIPEGVPLSHKLGKLKSWAAYTKNERKKTLDRLISEMIQAGVQTKHFSEILEGMNDQTV